jgi:hypothetical protein
MRLLPALLILGSTSLAACGGSAPPPAAAAPAAPASDAGKAAPAAGGGVSGTFKGTPFTSKGAIAKKHDQLEGAFKLFVAEDAVECSNFDGMEITGLKEGRRFLAANIEWKPGSKTEVQDFNTSFGIVGGAGSIARIGASGGTIEVVEAGQKAKIRVKATGKAGTLEGETSVTVCP